MVKVTATKENLFYVVRADGKLVACVLIGDSVSIVPADFGKKCIAIAGQGRILVDEILEPVGSK